MAALERFISPQTKRKIKLGVAGAACVGGLGTGGIGAQHLIDLDNNAEKHLQATGISAPTNKELHAANNRIKIFNIDTVEKRDPDAHPNMMSTDEARAIQHRATDYPIRKHYLKTRGPEDDVAWTLMGAGVIFMLASIKIVPKEFL